jgi:hypothetical protein
MLVEMTKSKEVIKSSASEISPLAQEQFDDVRTAQFEHGTINYSVIGNANPDKNPIIIAAGMDNGRVNLLAEADLLARGGATQVLITDQPAYNEDITNKFKKDPNSALNTLAEATIAAAEDAGFLDDDKVANMAGHSLGGLVAARIRQIAKAQNIKALLPENGSLLALMGSSGMDPKDNKLKLGLRWPKYALKGIVEAKALDPTGVNGKTVMGNASIDKSKTIGEVNALSQSHVPADIKGTLAIVYPEDKIFPVHDKRIKKTIEEGNIPFTTPIDAGKTSVKGLNRALTKAHLKGRNARLEYALSHRGAGHDDPANNPERTARVVIDFFDHPENYLGHDYNS